MERLILLGLNAFDKIINAALPKPPTYAKIYHKGQQKFSTIHKQNKRLQRP